MLCSHCWQDWDSGCYGVLCTPQPCTHMMSTVVKVVVTLPGPCLPLLWLYRTRLAFRSSLTCADLQF